VTLPNAVREPSVTQPIAPDADRVRLRGSNRENHSCSGIGWLRSAPGAKVVFTGKGKHP
jgi:hypothetical protein